MYRYVNKSAVTTMGFTSTFKHFMKWLSVKIIKKALPQDVSYDRIKT